MKISIYTTLSLVLVSIFIGISIGYFYTSDYKSSMYDKNPTMDLGLANKTFDLRYINAMIAHHRGAMLLAEQLGKNTQRPEMAALSQNILKDEPAAIEELYQWKKAWYNDTKKVKDPIVANLGSYDDKSDLRFLNAIIAHHEQGIMMTKETRIKSTRNEILNNADAVELFLSNGLKTLTELRQAWYNVN